MPSDNSLSSQEDMLHFLIPSGKTGCFENFTLTEILKNK